MTTIQVLEAERLKRGLTKKEWCRVLNQSYIHYTEMINGRRGVTFWLLRAAYASGISAEDLLKGGE